MFALPEPFLSSEIEYRRQRIASSFAASRPAASRPASRRASRRGRRPRLLRLPGWRIGEERIA